MAKKSPASNEWSIDPREVAQSLKRFAKSTDFVEGHYEELVAKHPKMWIAVLDGEIRAMSTTLGELLSEMDSEGIRVPETHLKFLDPDPAILVI
jgi:hypothetical protein